MLSLIKILIDMDYYQDFEQTIGAVIDSVKKMLYVRHKDIFQRIDFYDDEIYLEPLLYTYLHQQDNKWLDAVIYGYEKVKKREIAVFTNANGLVYLPNVGYLQTGVSNATLQLTTLEGEMVLRNGEGVVPFTMEPLVFSEDGIEIVKDQHPLLETVFADQGNRPEHTMVKDVYLMHMKGFNKGMRIIERNNPGHFNLLKRTLKKAMLFRSGRQHSFAVMSAHNMIFLNVNEWDDEIFFADHISHEGGHVTFFTLTYETRKELFTMPHDTPMGDLVGNPGQYPAIYLYFHGMFTFVEITKTLQGCIGQEGFSLAQQHDIKGRFVFHMQRFKLSLDEFERLGILREEGERWYEVFLKQYKEFEEEYLGLNGVYDFGDQPYDFNSKVFAKLNVLVGDDGLRP